MHPFERLFASLRPYRGQFVVDTSNLARLRHVMNRTCPIEAGAGLCHPLCDGTIADIDLGIKTFGMSERQAWMIIDAADLRHAHRGLRRKLIQFLCPERCYQRLYVV